MCCTNILANIAFLLIVLQASSHNEALGIPNQIFEISSSQPSQHGNFWKWQFFDFNNVEIVCSECSMTKRYNNKVLWIEEPNVRQDHLKINK
jgi:hypothetical protein